MRILIITDQFPPLDFGGMAQHAFHIARYLSQRHEVLVATLRGHDASVHADEAFDFRPILTKRFPRYDSWLIRRLASEFSADVVHAGTAGMADRRLCHEFPVVTRTVGNDFIRPWYGYNFLLRNLLYRVPNDRFKEAIKRRETRKRQAFVIRALRANQTVAANSNWTRDQLIKRGLKAGRIKTVVGGLDINTFNPPDDKVAVRKELGLPVDAPVITTAGNLIRKKGFDTVLRALARLDLEPRPHYALVGDGPEEANLHQLANELGLRERAWFVGRKSQAELAQFYQASDIYVQVSRNHKLSHGYEDVETMGRTYFEAGACGIAVIGARVGGVPDVVEHGMNGLLVDDPEDVDAVAEAIQRLLADEALREQMGQAGLKRARAEFSWEAVGAEFEELLTEAVGQGGGRKSEGGSQTSEVGGRGVA